MPAVLGDRFAPVSVPATGPCRNAPMTPAAPFPATAPARTPTGATARARPSGPPSRAWRGDSLSEATSGPVSTAGGSSGNRGQAPRVRPNFRGAPAHKNPSASVEPSLAARDGISNGPDHVAQTPRMLVATSPRNREAEGCEMATLARRPDATIIVAAFRRDRRAAPTTAGRPDHVKATPGHGLIGRVNNRRFPYLPSVHDRASGPDISADRVGMPERDRQGLHRTPPRVPPRLHPARPAGDRRQAALRQSGRPAHAVATHPATFPRRGSPFAGPSRSGDAGLSQGPSVPSRRDPPEDGLRSPAPLGGAHPT